jgi:hypothetical protein
MILKLTDIMREGDLYHTKTDGIIPIVYWSGHPVSDILMEGEYVERPDPSEHDLELLKEMRKEMIEDDADREDEIHNARYGN